LGQGIDTNAINVQPFGVDPGIVKAAQRANQKLARGEMAGTDNPFISHRSGAMDKVKLKEQEWGSMGHEYVTEAGEGGVAAVAPDAGDEAAYLASLSKKDRKLLAKYTKKLGGATDGGAIDKKSKKHKKEKKHKKKSKKHKKKSKKSRGSSSSDSSSS
jgi:hypothetical protein